MDRLLAAIDERTALVAVSHVLFRSAYILDVAAICRRAREVGARVSLDAFHSVGVMPVDVTELGVDFLSGGVLKWLCGGPGGAFLYASPEASKTLTPSFTGWQAHERPFGFESDMRYAEGAWRWLNGTPPIPALFAAVEGPRIVRRAGIDAIRAKSIRQTSRLIELADARGYRVSAPRDAARRGGTVAFDVPHSYGVSRALLANDVIVDYRPERRHSRRAALLHVGCGARARRLDDRRHSARRGVETVRGREERRHMIRAVALGAAVAVSVAGASRNAVQGSRFTHADTASLHRSLDAVASAHRGVLGYAVWNIDTGERLSLRGDETFPTASLIKVPILVTLYDLAEQKQLSLDDPLTVLKIDQVPGSGVLQFMHPGMSLSVHDVASLMIVLSDNTATNLLLDRIAIRRVWTKMESLGLPHTKVHSKTFLRLTSVAMDSSVKYGLGVSTPNEMAHLFALLADGKAVSPAADSAMLEILRNNADGDSMQRSIDGLSVPHKTGATDSVRTECALFRLQSRVVACGFTKQNADIRWVVDNEAQVALGKIGALVVGAWPKAEAAK